MAKLVFDYKNALGFVREHEIDYLKKHVEDAHEKLHNKTGPGSDFWAGWSFLTIMIRKSFHDLKAARKIREDLMY